MNTLRFDLYLDESGDFDDQNRNTIARGFEPSLVGGLLCKSTMVTPALLRQIPEQLHATELYDKPLFFKLLDTMKKNGGQFIIFENTERINVVNGDVTYLNIISEGIVKLLRKFAVDYPEDKVELNILVAQRLDVTYKTEEHISRVIPAKEYLQRLEEKIILSMGRQQIGSVYPTIKMGDARYEKRLMLADLICNTYKTQNAPRKFTDADREYIKSLYDDEYIFPVFENATLGYINRLFIDGRYEEVISQICTLNRPSGIAKIKNKVISRILGLSFNEQKVIFSYMSLHIRQFNSRRLFIAGIQFAENYKNLFLHPLEEQSGGKYTNLGQELKYWTFDTDFYILTMYDHLGNATKCSEYIEKCRTNVDSICSSWEHIAYYFQFKIRQLNCMLGQFQFQEVIEKSTQLISVLKDAKEVFSMIGTYEDVEIDPSSELLGKVNGVRLEALINLIPKDSSLFDKAIQASDEAMDEFNRPQDLQRQWQYRSMLYVETKRCPEAVECLLKSYDISSSSPHCFEKFLDKTFQSSRIEMFSLFHYVNVLLLLSKMNRPLSSQMAEALFKNKRFSDAINNSSLSGHPWNLILWKTSKILRCRGNITLADSLYRKALSVTLEYPENATMYTFSLSMSADYIIELGCSSPKSLTAELKQYEKLYSRFERLNLPASFKKQFPSGTNDATLAQVANAFLR